MAIVKPTLEEVREEAGKKFCPYARATFRPYELKPNGRGQAGFVVNRNALCVAEQCMNWRESEGEVASRGWCSMSGDDGWR